MKAVNAETKKDEPHVQIYWVHLDEWSRGARHISMMHMMQHV